MVSVVVPTFNRAYCLGRTLESALSQSHRELEVVVVDDGSSDGTADLVAAFGARDARVRYVRQDNAGVAAARNHGFRMVRGAYVALLDSDDLWRPWKIEMQVTCLETLPEAGMVWTEMEAIDTDGRVLCPRYIRSMYSAYRFFPRPEDLFATSQPVSSVAPGLATVAGAARVYLGNAYPAIVLGNLVHTSTVLLRRERLERVGGFDEALRYAGEDHDFHLRTCREGPVAFIDLPTMSYQRGLADRLTRPEYSAHMARNFLATVEKALRHDPDRVLMLRPRLRQVLAEGHAWAGGAALEQGDRRGAIHHLAASLRHQPLQPRVVAALALASLPRGMSEGLRNAYRRARKAHWTPGGRDL
jgi:GT2 family glycosyltransferase